MATALVSYALDDETVVRFEMSRPRIFDRLDRMKIAGRIREAVVPAVEGARAVLEQAKEVGPREIGVKFWLKVSGTANWFVAKAATEGDFEIRLPWTPQPAAAT